MAVAELVPIAEYLRTTYHPDREYLEGELKERNVGERGHSRTQSLTLVYLHSNYGSGYWTTVEWRVQVRANRFRVPDVTVVRKPEIDEPYATVPPYLVIEVLSPDDTASDLQDKIEDYLTMGIETVWVLDPRSKRGFVHTHEGSHAAKDGVLTAGEISMPLSAVFSE